MDKILKFLKEREIDFYLCCAAALLLIIALVIAGISCSGPGYLFSQFYFVIICSIAALILTAAVICIPIFFSSGDKLMVTIMTAVQTVLMIGVIALSTYCIIIMIDGKLQLMGNIWFSNLERGKPVPEFALNAGVVSMVFYLLSIIMLSAGAFFTPRFINKTIKEEGSLNV